MHHRRPPASRATSIIPPLPTPGSGVAAHVAPASFVLRPTPHPQALSPSSPLMTNQRLLLMQIGRGPEPVTPVRTTGVAQPPPWSRLYSRGRSEEHTSELQ